MGKHVCLHTHFNHPREITWATEAAGAKLWANGVVVRNQTVLLKGVNDDVKTMSQLLHGLADINIQPVSYHSVVLFLRY
jgi:lysine 2,3-aminomutase